MKWIEYLLNLNFNSVTLNIIKNTMNENKLNDIILGKQRLVHENTNEDQ